MRIAFISDIHGNYQALTAVLTEIDAFNIEQIVCLGDVASLGGEPQKVVETLRTRNIPMLMGNHDAFVTGVEDVANYEWADDLLTDFTSWTANQLTSADMEYIKNASFDLCLSVENHAIYCVHGSPRSYFEQMIATNTPQKLDEMLATVSEKIIVAGHTHIPLLRRYKDTLLLNAGSVGIALDENPPSNRHFITHWQWAEYLIVTVENESVSAEFRRINIDQDAVLAQFRQCGFPRIEEWLKN